MSMNQFGEANFTSSSSGSTSSSFNSSSSSSSLFSSPLTQSQLIKEHNEDNKRIEAVRNIIKLRESCSQEWVKGFLDYLAKDNSILQKLANSECDDIRDKLIQALNPRDNGDYYGRTSFLVVDEHGTGVWKSANGDILFSVLDKSVFEGCNIGLFTGDINEYSGIQKELVIKIREKFKALLERIIADGKDLSDDDALCSVGFYVKAYTEEKPCLQTFMRQVKIGEKNLYHGAKLSSLNFTTAPSASVLATVPAQSNHQQLPQYALFKN